MTQKALIQMRGTNERPEKNSIIHVATQTQIKIIIPINLKRKTVLIT